MAPGQGTQRLGLEQPHPSGFKLSAPGEALGWGFQGGSHGGHEVAEGEEVARSRGWVAGLCHSLFQGAQASHISVRPSNTPSSAWPHS